MRRQSSTDFFSTKFSCCTRRQRTQRHGTQQSSRAVFAFWVKRDAPATGVGTVNVRSCVIWGWFVAFAAFIGGFLLLRNKAQHPHSVLTFLRKSDVFDRHHDFL
jgi:hypothetical protein